jgi:ACS family pantothenate transporter-like MFS transporter
MVVDLYQQAALYSGMNGVGGLSGWRWLFIFDGVITFPMAVWGKSYMSPSMEFHESDKILSGYLALPDLPSNTRVPWLKKHEKELAVRRAKEAGKGLDEPVTVAGTLRVLKKWHFWVYTAYYT